MTTATCIFEVLNEGSSEMLLYLEPEGSEFRLPPGRVVEVRLFGSERPIEMKQATDSDGRRMLSFWPDRGAYELFFDGKDVRELLS